MISDGTMEVVTKNTCWKTIILSGNISIVLKIIALIS